MIKPLIAGDTLKVKRTIEGTTTTITETVEIVGFGYSDKGEFLVGVQNQKSDLYWINGSVVKRDEEFELGYASGNIYSGATKQDIG